MNKYVIGIVDEDKEDVDDIKRAILVNKPNAISEEQICFQVYPIPADTDGIVSIISGEVINDITEGVIQSIIVDYKIMSSVKLVEGTDIFLGIKEAASKFPAILLTNLPEDCYDKEFVDADKIYSKHKFFKLEEEYSKEKTLNIFKNMDNYSSVRARLSTRLASYLYTLESEGYSEKTLGEIIETEKLLNDFFPQQQSTIEKELDIAGLKNAVDLIKEANSILGDCNED